MVPYGRLLKKHALSEVEGPPASFSALEHAHVRLYIPVTKHVRPLYDAPGNESPYWTVLFEQPQE